MASGDSKRYPTTTYTMGGGEEVKKQRKHHRRGYNNSGSGNLNNSASLNSENSMDDNGSLTYSAGSSIHSSGSATGESTDSSFADIMRVLDIQDSSELTNLIKKDKKGIGAKFLNSNASASSSLNYSTDGDSALNGEQLLQTITGQPSDSYGPDGGGLGLLVEEEEEQVSMSEQSNVMFAAADPVNDNKKAKSPKKKVARRRRSKAGSSTPPRPRTKEVEETNEPQEVWYTKWWMCGFQDAFRDLVPENR